MCPLLVLNSPKPIQFPNKTVSPYVSHPVHNKSIKKAFETYKLIFGVLRYNKQVHCEIIVLVFFFLTG